MTRRVTKDYEEEVAGPYRGINAREYAAIKGQFRHLMNCHPEDTGVFGRFGTAHVGQAASVKSTLQNDTVQTGFHDECDHKIVRHITLKWSGVGIDGYPLSTTARFIWSSIPQNSAAGFVWMQLLDFDGAWHTFNYFLESCPDDPQIQTVMINNVQYFCTGYGPLYRIEQARISATNTFRVYPAEGVNRHADDGSRISYIMGALPFPIAITVVKNNVLAFVGIRNGDTKLMGSVLLPSPTLATPEKQAGGSLIVGTTYYCRVTLVDEYGVESAGSNEVNRLILPDVELEGLHLSVTTQKSFKLSWLSVPHGARYRVYVGVTTGVYFDHFETTEQSFVYGGQAGLGAAGCPTISGPMQTKYGAQAGRTVAFFDVQSATDGNELALKAENFCVIKSTTPEDINDHLVGGAEVDGGMVVYTRKSVTRLPLGGIIDPAINPFDPVDLAQGIGLAATRARVNVKKREYFIDGCGKGVFMTDGLSAPVEVSTSWADYFAGVSPSGIDPFNLDVNRLKYAHAVDDSTNGRIYFWLPMGNSNNRIVQMATEFCAVYSYDNVIPQRAKDSTDWWAFNGKGAYYDPWGWINVIERGFAFASADMLESGAGRTLYFGGYDGYSSVQDVNFMDATQSAAVASAVSNTTIRFDLDKYPGLKQRNDHVGGWMEVIDNGASGVPPSGTPVNDARRYIIAVRDIYWNNVDTAWTSGAGSSDPLIVATDGIDQRGCMKVTLVNAGLGVVIASNPVALTNLGAGDKIRVWLKVERSGSAYGYPAGTFEFIVDDTAGCASPIGSWDVPELLNGKWTECVFTVAAPLANVISIGLRLDPATGVVAGGDKLYFDHIDLQSKRYVEYDIASAFLDADGVAAPLTSAMTVRIYWDINARVAIKPLGLDAPAGTDFMWQSITTRYRCAGEQSVRCIFTCDPDGWSPVLLVMAMPRSDTPQYSTTDGVPSTIPAPGLPVGTPVLPPNQLADGTIALVERAYAYWSYASLPGHNDVRAEVQGIGRYGGPLYFMVESQDRHQFSFFDYIGRGTIERMAGR